MEKLEIKFFDKITPEIKNQIKKRIQEFKELNKSDNISWFNELCFCLLTANTSADKAIKIQIAMGKEGFREKTQTELALALKKLGYRFYNIRSSYIVLARKFAQIKEMLQKMENFEAREFLVTNVKGLGYKEASHFLRNVGYSDFAIIDRHILRFLLKNKLIDEIPKTISPKKYIELEKILARFNIPQDELDLIIWAQMTGKVLK